MSSGTSPTKTAFATLRRFTKRQPVVERCELCSLQLATQHEHLVEPASRQILCACQACAILFSGDSETRYQRVPRTVVFLPNFQLTDGQWHSMAIPIGMAFFFHSTPAKSVVCVYPSPGGPTETLIEDESWNDLETDNPVLSKLEPDTQALLVNRLGETRDTYIAPIDECYKLTGLIRTHWQGFSGGTEVWGELETFFTSLKRRSTPTSKAMGGSSRA